MARVYKHVTPGETNGYLTIIARHGLAKDGLHVIWKARCSCGDVVTVATSAFRSGKSCMKCGRERTRLSRMTQEGATLKNSIFRKLWDIHRRMLRRCNDVKSDKYKWYGGKGIKVCEEWQKFKTFRAWAMSHGYKQGLTIERRNPRLNYSPSNCEWITKSENSWRARTYVHSDGATSGLLSFGT